MFIWRLVSCNFLSFHYFFKPNCYAKMGIFFLPRAFWIPGTAFSGHTQLSVKNQSARDLLSLESYLQFPWQPRINDLGGRYTARGPAVPTPGMDIYCLFINRKVSRHYFHFQQGEQQCGFPKNYGKVGFWVRGEGGSRSQQRCANGCCGRARSGPLRSTLDPQSLGLTLVLLPSNCTTVQIIQIFRSLHFLTRKKKLENAWVLSWGALWYVVSISWWIFLLLKKYGFLPHK